MDDWLFMTPMFTDDSYDDDEDTWLEVDFMSALGEEEYIQIELDRVDDVLRNEIKLQTI